MDKFPYQIPLNHFIWPFSGVYRLPMFIHWKQKKSDVWQQHNIWLRIECCKVCVRARADARSRSRLAQNANGSNGLMYLAINARGVKQVSVSSILYGCSVENKIKLFQWSHHVLAPAHSILLSPTLFLDEIVLSRNLSGIAVLSPW